jgi:hypothetical protein
MFYLLTANKYGLSHKKPGLHHKKPGLNQEKTNGFFYLKKKTRKTWFKPKKTVFCFCFFQP